MKHEGGRRKDEIGLVSNDHLIFILHSSFFIIYHSSLAMLPVVIVMVKAPRADLLRHVSCLPSQSLRPPRLPYALSRMSSTPRLTLFQT